MRKLTDSFLQSLVNRLDDDNAVGATLAGSFARGEGRPYQDTTGRESDLTRQYRLAMGLDPLSTERPVFIGRGIAGLQLYCETARILQDILQPEDAVLVNRATEINREAGC